jgi:FkbM family methyltransferase
VFQQLKTPILNKIPMTRVKLFIAWILYLLAHTTLRKNNCRIRRKGVAYDVDISEGVDLSLFLFGNFQGHITNNRYFTLKDDAVIFDVGANIGSMALRFAQHASRGHVYAFEPTDFAFRKFLNNLALNPHLAKRITPVQLFLSDQTKSDHKIQAYASWKVDGSISNTHPMHGGAIKPAKSVPAVTLDDYCLKHKIHKIDLIKIDTDGHEFSILNGATQTVEKSLPYIIFEIGLYVLKEQNITFERIYAYFANYDYYLLNAKNGKQITLQNYSYRIPKRSTTDLLAVPVKQSPNRKKYF